MKGARLAAAPPRACCSRLDASQVEDGRCITGALTHPDAGAEWVEGQSSDVCIMHLGEHRTRRDLRGQC